MSLWRRTALERLPELKRPIEAAPNVMALWIELHGVLAAAYGRAPADPRWELSAGELSAEDLIGRLYAYAAWTWERGDPVPCQAVACAFYEHLPEDEAIARDLPRRMTRGLFTELESAFRYRLSGEEFAALRMSFLERRRAIEREIRP